MNKCNHHWIWKKKLYVCKKCGKRVRGDEDAAIDKLYKWTPFGINPKNGL